MSAGLRLAAVWVDGDGRDRVGLRWKVKLLRGLLCSGQRRKEGTIVRMKAFQVCSFINTRSQSPKPRAAAGGVQGLCCWPRPICTRAWWWVCVRGYLASAHGPGPFILPVDDSILQSSRSLKGRKATLFCYFPGSPSLLSSVVSLISGSDIRDRREIRLKVIMLL